MDRLGGATRVPLVIVPQKAGTAAYQVDGSCASPVGLIDLYPTLVELCELPAQEGLDGQSLVPLLKDPARETKPVITTFDYQNYSIRDVRWRLIRYQDGSEELYDHDADPNEWHNLANDVRHEAVLKRMRTWPPADPAASVGPAAKGD